MTTLYLILAAAAYGAVLGLLPDRVSLWWSIFTCLAVFVAGGYWWLLLLGLAAGHRAASKSRRR